MNVTTVCLQKKENEAQFLRGIKMSKKKKKKFLENFFFIFSYIFVFSTYNICSGLIFVH